MGLISSMSNAVSGLRINQDSIDILSRNVANAGTPGYHRQSLNVIDYNAQTGSYARSQGVERAFSSSLQTYYTRQVSDTASAGVAASYLTQLQSYLGKPGEAGSLDTMYGSLKNAMSSLATSPDDYSTRAKAVSEAQAMAQRLNQLSTTVQELRQDTETQLSNNVNNLNGMLTSLAEVNARMLDLGMTDGARSSLLDQRDRLVSSVAELIDVQASYRSDGTVALMTRSGVGLLDNGVSTFKFTTAGSLAPTSLASGNPAENKVGSLTLTTPSGLTIDLVQSGILQGGELGGLVTLRDKTLVEVQSQLDEIAAGLASAFSTITTPASDVKVGDVVTGKLVDIWKMKPGNDLTLSYSENGVEKRVRVVNSDSGEDYIDASGQRVIALDLSKPESAAALQDKLGLTVTNPTPDLLQIMNTGGRTVTSLASRTTASATQNGDLGLSLFVDQGNSPFTNDLDGNPPQKVGFAGRITINAEVLADNRLMVQYGAGGTLGDDARPKYILDQLEKMDFLSGGAPGSSDGQFQLSGNLGEMIGQVLNFQGSSIGSATTNLGDRQMTLDTITDQMKTAYGVNVNEEMARLMELQNAYAANARVISVVKELLDALFAST